MIVIEHEEIYLIVGNLSVYICVLLILLMSLGRARHTRHAHAAHGLGFLQVYDVYMCLKIDVDLTVFAG